VRAPEAHVAFWNRSFGYNHAPGNVRKKIVAADAKTVMSDRARKPAADPCAAVCWQIAGGDIARIEAAIDTAGRFEPMPTRT